MSILPEIPLLLPPQITKHHYSSTLLILEWGFTIFRNNQFHDYYYSKHMKIVKSITFDHRWLSRWLIICNSFQLILRHPHNPIVSTPIFLLLLCRLLLRCCHIDTTSEVPMNWFVLVMVLMHFRVCVCSNKDDYSSVRMHKCVFCCYVITFHFYLTIFTQLFLLV